MVHAEFLFGVQPPPFRSPNNSIRSNFARDSIFPSSTFHDGLQSPRSSGWRNFTADLRGRRNGMRGENFLQTLNGRFFTPQSQGGFGRRKSVDRRGSSSGPSFGFQTPRRRAGRSNDRYASAPQESQRRPKNRHKKRRNKVDCPTDGKILAVPQQPKAPPPFAPLLPPVWMADDLRPQTDSRYAASMPMSASPTVSLPKAKQKHKGSEKTSMCDSGPSTSGHDQRQWHEDELNAARTLALLGRLPVSEDHTYAKTQLTSKDNADATRSPTETAHQKSEKEVTDFGIGGLPYTTTSAAASALVIPREPRVLPRVNDPIDVNVRLFHTPLLPRWRDMTTPLPKRPRALSRAHVPPRVLPRVNDPWDAKERSWDLGGQPHAATSKRAVKETHGKHKLPGNRSVVSDHPYATSSQPGTGIIQLQDWYHAHWTGDNASTAKAGEGDNASTAKAGNRSVVSDHPYATSSQPGEGDNASTAKAGTGIKASTAEAWERAKELSWELGGQPHAATSKRAVEETHGKHSNRSVVSDHPYATSSQPGNRSVVSDHPYATSGTGIKASTAEALRAGIEAKSQWRHQPPPTAAQMLAQMRGTPPPTPRKKGVPAPRTVAQFLEASGSGGREVGKASAKAARPAEKEHRDLPPPSNMFEGGVVRTAASGHAAMVSESQRTQSLRNEEDQEHRRQRQHVTKESSLQGNLLTAALQQNGETIERNEGDGDGIDLEVEGDVTSMNGTPLMLSGLLLFNDRRRGIRVAVTEVTPRLANDEGQPQNGDGMPLPSEDDSKP